MAYKKESTHHGTKMKLFAEFIKYSKYDFSGNPRCVDLVDVRKENGKLVAKRICLSYINRFQGIGELKTGDRISFMGWVLMGKVTHPTRVTKVIASLVSEEIPLKPSQISSD
ncbi:hypothetical protein [Methanolobus sp.]|uniref:hypothetical protein n=1 Tax=Methanolobus sp. TaxID=1874737 RepID=UPI0025F26F1F|nr:hypothetical protein [Methanolobus sp.]